THQALAGNAVDPHHAGHGPGHFTSAPMGHQLVTLTDLFDRKIEKRPRFGSALAQETKTVAMRQKYHGGGRKRDLLAIYFRHAAPCRDDDEDHRIHKPRHDDPPGSSHGRPAIERSGQP